MEQVKLPISEIFTSWQGEGLWSGTRMTFIRLAGCSVGKFIPQIGTINDDSELKVTSLGVLPVWQEECTTFDGRKFCCDTDFRVKERLTVDEILKQVPEGVEHICITGGEPLIHLKGVDLLIDTWYDNHMMNHTVHIETSGTIDYQRKYVWITVSPKHGCLAKMIRRANEVKFLVDENFNEETIQLAEQLASYDTDGDTIFWLSPINGTNSLDKNNLDKAKEIAERHPNWRITQQSHKIWGVR